MFPGSEQLRREADKCVKCGLCAPHCPTYLLEANENESPRGRIALMQGLASGQLSATPALHAHLQHCLTCRACERACPAGVRFAPMLDKTRDVLRRSHPPGWQERFGLWWVAHRRLWGGFTHLIQLLRAIGLLNILQQSRIFYRLGLTSLQRLVDLVPPRQPNPRVINVTSAHRQGRVALFTGCMGQVLDSAGVAAARRLLNRLGYEVVIPSAQTCCGALHQHNGDTATALQLAKQNVACFEQLQVDAILYLASGCGAQLSEYASLPWEDGHLQTQAETLIQKFNDATSFINTALTQPKIKLRPLNARVAVHESCTQRNVLHNTTNTYALLQHIAEITLTPLPSNAQCCGAAGSYLLTQAARANALREKKIAPWLQDPTDFIVSNNAGCRIHLAEAVKANSPDVEVLHPLELLERQLEID